MAKRKIKGIEGIETINEYDNDKNEYFINDDDIIIETNKDIEIVTEINIDNIKRTNIEYRIIGSNFIYQINEIKKVFEEMKNKNINISQEVDYFINKFPKYKKENIVYNNKKGIVSLYFNPNNRIRFIY